jgi:2-(1,2-epoxy-1,2-dihydrophenyl)acetyl-CoA isomerase
MSAESRRVSFAIDRAIARLTLTRRDRRNAIDPAWVTDLECAVGECARDDELRAVLICADGPAFTVGGDLDHFAAEADRLPDALEEMIAPYHRTLATLAELPAPVVCAAQGAIAGGGLGLLWAADVVLLADDARLATGFSKLGLSGDGGSSWYLPRLVGLRRSTQLILQGRTLTAAEALEWHLADRVVPVAQLTEAAEATVRTLADGPTLAYGEMRRLIRRALDHDLEAGLRAELDAVKRCGATADAREGITAFAARHAPDFDGR